MKQYRAWPLFLALITLALASCYQDVEVEPEPIKVDGLYHTMYFSPEDSTHFDVNLGVKQVNDSVYQAQMAFYHYYKDNLLFSEVTELCEPVINHDTILLNLVMSEEKKMGTTKSANRPLNVMLRYVNDTLRLLSTSNDDILPKDLSLFFKALTPEDSTAIRFDALLPRMTMLEGMYFINGPIKKFSASSRTGYTYFEYYFDENGIVTGYKGTEGKTYNYEVGDLGDGGYFSFLKRQGWNAELSYNNAYQLVSDNTRRNLISYYYDPYGRMTDGYYKNSRIFYSFELERDAHGTLVGVWNKSSEKYEMKYIVREVDHYGNPLEQSMDCRGYVSNPCFYNYEYYE